MHSFVEWVRNLGKVQSKLRMRTVIISVESNLFLSIFVKLTEMMKDGQAISKYLQYHCKWFVPVTSDSSKHFALITNQ